MIEVELPDGTIIEFPEGTPRDVIQRVAAETWKQRQYTKTSDAIENRKWLQPVEPLPEGSAELKQEPAKRRGGTTAELRQTAYAPDREIEREKFADKFIAETNYLPGDEELKRQLAYDKFDKGDTKIGPPPPPVDRVAQYMRRTENPLGLEEATKAAQFDERLQGRLQPKNKEPLPHENPDVSGMDRRLGSSLYQDTGEKGFGIPYNPNTQIEAREAEEKRAKAERELARQKAWLDEAVPHLSDRGILKGAIGSYGATVGLLGFAADALGVDWGKDTLRAQAKDAQEMVALLSTAKSASDIRSLGDLGEWFQENFGYVAYQALETLATGGASKLLTKAAGMSGGKETVIQALAIGANNVRQTLGSMYNEAQENYEQGKGPKPNLVGLAVGALGSAFIDTWADKMGLDALTSKGVKGDFLTRLGKTLPAQMGVQGGTEALQTIPEELGKSGRLPTLKQMFDEGAVGAIGGLGPGGVGALRRAPDSPEEQFAQAFQQDIDSTRWEENSPVRAGENVRPGVDGFAIKAMGGGFADNQIRENRPVQRAPETPFESIVSPESAVEGVIGAGLPPIVDAPAPAKRPSILDRMGITPVQTPAFVQPNDDGVTPVDSGLAVEAAQTERAAQQAQELADEITAKPEGTKNVGIASSLQSEIRRLERERGIGGVFGDRATEQEGSLGVDGLAGQTAQNAGVAVRSDGQDLSLGSATQDNALESRSEVLWTGSTKTGYVSERAAQKALETGAPQAKNPGLNWSVEQRGEVWMPVGRSAQTQDVATAAAEMPVAAPVEAPKILGRTVTEIPQTQLEQIASSRLMDGPVRQIATQELQRRTEDAKQAEITQAKQAEETYVAERLTEAFNRGRPEVDDSGKPIERVAITPMQGVRLPETEAIVDVARALGAKVVVADGLPTRGVYLRDEDGAGLVGINAKGANSPEFVVTVVGHEVGHLIKRESPQAYRQWSEAVGDYIKEGVVQKRLAAENANLQPGEAPVDIGRAREEVEADISGEMWKDKGFWQILINKDKNLFRKVYYHFMSTMATAVEAARGKSPSLINSLVTDVNAVRELAAELYLEHVGVKLAPTSKREMSAETKTAEVLKSVPADMHFSRPYENAPNSLMGYRKNGPQKSFGESKYKHVEYVRVSWAGKDSMLEAMRGLNKSHALERAWRNWADANSIESVPKDVVLKEDPALVREVERQLVAKPDMKFSRDDKDELGAFNEFRNNDEYKDESWSFKDADIKKVDGDGLIIEGKDQELTLEDEIAQAGYLVRQADQPSEDKPKSGIESDLAALNVGADTEVFGNGYKQQYQDKVADGSLVREAIAEHGHMAEKGIPPLVFTLRKHDGRDYYVAQGLLDRMYVVRPNSGKFIAYETDKLGSATQDNYWRVDSLEEARRWNNANHAAAVLRKEGFDLADTLAPAKRKTLVNVWRQISKMDGAFSMPTPERSTYKFSKIAAEMGEPGWTDGSMSTGFYVETSSGDVTLENEGGGVYHANTIGFEKGSSAGSRFYPVAFMWARNNRYVLTGDKTLSYVNSFRRTEQMLSAGLRDFETQFMRPSDQQRIYGWNKNPRTDQENEDNIVRMLLAAHRNYREFVSVNGIYRYNVPSGKFEKQGDDGSWSDAGKTSALSFSLAEPDARGAGLGTSTVARSLVTEAALRLDLSGLQPNAGERGKSGERDSSASEGQYVPRDRRSLDDRGDQEAGKTGTVGDDAAQKAARVSDLAGIGKTPTLLYSRNFDQDSTKAVERDTIESERLDGVPISYEVRVEDTGDVASVTLDSGAAVRDYQARIDSMRKLLECMG